MDNGFDTNKNTNEEPKAAEAPASEAITEHTEAQTANVNEGANKGYYYSAPSNGQQGAYGNPYRPSQNGYYSPQGQGYRPYGNPQGSYYGGPNRQGGYYGGPATGNGKPAEKSKPKGASKGFVVGMVAIGLVISFILGTFSSVIISALINSGDGGTVTGGKTNVVIQYAPKDENKVEITDKGDVAYVASLVSSTVVEVTTETVTTDDTFGNYITQGAGSGVIVSSTESGSHIITCAHVIEGATKVTVTLKDGTSYEATEFFCDAESDVGVIKIAVKGLPTCVIGDFSKVVVGEEVIAIGNPLGTLGGSVTNGVVSALDRDIIIGGTTYHLLQTNAEINPGNSGGGLFNTKGQLIGIVNAKSTGDNIEGLGFAIPIDDAVAIMTDLLEKGYVSGRVKLGFQLIEIQTQEDVKYWWKYSRYFTDTGVYIITSEDPAFEEGDLLVAIDDTPIGTLTDLKALLQTLEVGQTVEVTVSRIVGKNVKLMTYELTLKEKTN